MDGRKALEKMKEMGWTIDDIIERVKVFEEAETTVEDNKKEVFMLHTLNSNEKNKVFSKRCIKYLIELGISSELTGFGYLRDVVQENLQYDVLREKGLMELCDRVGKKNNIKRGTVYVNIVRAVESGWKKYGVIVWKNVLKMGILRMPTVSEIVTILSERIVNDDMSVESDSESEELNREKLIKACEAYLNKLEISSKLKGYRYLREAVLINIKFDAMVYGSATAIYRTIAKKYGDTDISVARTIRYVIIKSWRKSDKTVLKETFGFVSNEVYPTNCEFISTLSFLVRNAKV